MGLYYHGVWCHGTRGCSPHERPPSTRRCPRPAPTQGLPKSPWRHPHGHSLSLARSEYRGRHDTIPNPKHDSADMRRWMRVARLTLKRPSAVWMVGCSGSAASMAAAAAALQPGRDACRGTDGPSTFCPRATDGDWFKGLECTWGVTSDRAKPQWPLLERGVSTWGWAAGCGGDGL